MSMNEKVPTYQSSQPMASPTMTVTGDSKNALNLLKDGEGKRDWSHGLFSCQEACGTCCFGMFCPCMLYAKNRTRLQHLDKHNSAHPSGGDGVGADCCVYAVLGYFMMGWVLQINNRGHERERYDIRGNTLNDVFAAACCHVCALTQESRELDEEEAFLKKSAN